MAAHLNSFSGLANFLAHNAFHQYRHNCHQVLDEVGYVVSRAIESRVGIYRPGWQPLAASTLEKKARMGWGLGGNPDTPLYATGDFQRDIGFTVRKSSLSVTIGTTKDYILYTELGTLGGRIPPRPIFEPTALEIMPSLLPRIQQVSAAGVAGFAVEAFPRAQTQSTIFTP